MRKTRNAKLNLLSLESRLTPAVTAKLSGGSLNINGDDASHMIFIYYKAGGVTDVRVAPGFVNNAAGQATTNGGAYETSTPLLFSGVVTKDIRVRDGNGSSTAVVLTIDDGETVPGKVEIRTGDGNNDITVQSRNNSFGIVNGPLNIKPGNGTNNVWVFDTDVIGKTNVTGTYAGARNVFQTSHSHYGDNVTVANSAVIIDHNFGPVVMDGNLRVRQSITVSNPGNYQNMDGVPFPPGAKLGDPGIYHGFLVIDSAADDPGAGGGANHIKGTVSFNGCKSHDGVFINGIIDGDVLISGNGGDDDFFIGDDASRGVLGYQYKAAIGGSLKVRGNNGVDHLRFYEGSTVAGDASFDMGSGANIYDLNHTFAVTGTFSLRATTGNDVVGKIGGTTGDLKIDLGEGANSIQFSATGGNINYRSGNGNDSVTLSGAYASFTGRFNGGSDVFSYLSGASLGSFLNADGGSGTDVFNINGVAESWTVTRKNWETVNP